MDLSLISVEPHASATAAKLAILGIMACLALRRWRHAIVLVAPLLAYLTWDLVRQLAPMSVSLARPEVRSYVLPEFAICLVGLLMGLGLPTLAWRRASRPAAQPVAAPDGRLRRK
jgi:hypothetical protein